MALNVGILDVEELDKDYVVVVQLKTSPDGVLQNVTLRPSKVKQIMRTCPCCGNSGKTAIIRLGDSHGDEVLGWQRPENIFVVAVMGIAEIGATETKVLPLS